MLRPTIEFVEKKLSTQMDAIIKPLTDRLAGIELQLKLIQHENSALTEELRRIQHLSDVIIGRIPEKDGENLSKLLENICAVVKHTVCYYSYAFRLKNKMQKGKKYLDPLIAVCFSCPAEKRAFLSAVWNHRGIKLGELEGYSGERKIDIKESLSPKVRELLWECRKLKDQGKIFTTFTRDGIAYVKLKKEDRAIKVCDLSQLQKLLV